MSRRSRRQYLSVLLFSLLMLNSALTAAAESIRFAAVIDASCQVHAVDANADELPLSIDTSGDCESHQCCLPHGSQIPLSQQTLALSPLPSGKWLSPGHVYFSSLTSPPPVPPPSSNG